MVFLFRLFLFLLLKPFPLQLSHLPAAAAQQLLEGTQSSGCLYTLLVITAGCRPLQIGNGPVDVPHSLLHLTLGAGPGHPGKMAGDIE